MVMFGKNYFSRRGPELGRGITEEVQSPTNGCPGNEGRKMFRRIVNLSAFLAGLGIFWAAGPLMGDTPYTEIRVNNQRCLLAGPANLPEAAPVVFLLHGLGANAENLVPLMGAMDLPPCRFVFPEAPMKV